MDIGDFFKGIWVHIAAFFSPEQIKKVEQSIADDLHSFINGEKAILWAGILKIARDCAAKVETMDWSTYTDPEIRATAKAKAFGAIILPVLAADGISVGINAIGFAREWVVLEMNKFFVSRTVPMEPTTAVAPAPPA